MAANTEDVRSGCTIQWKIENISHCWLKTREAIKSPSFIADAVGGTKWSLLFYPKGYYNESFVRIRLQREADCSAPNEVAVSFQLAYLDKHGSILKEGTYSNQKFGKGISWGNKADELRERVFSAERESFLPGDTLTLQCTIWNTDERPLKTQNFCARTVYKVNRRCFDLRIDEFSTRKFDLTNKFEDELMEFDIVLKEGVDDEIKKLAIEIKSFDESVKYASFTTSIVDKDGLHENLGTHEYFIDDLKIGVKGLWFLTETLMKNKIRYFPNDILSLNCEYVLSNGAILYQYCHSDTIFPTLTNEAVVRKNEPYIVKEESLNTAVILKDFKQMYNDGSFSDTELRTSTKTFPAHQCLLSARSPVFKKMFSNDMKEKNSGHVDITDCDEDTVQRMLLYIYTDSMEDMQFEGALKLYTIADKYEIVSLKSRCSPFLKENLCPTNVCDALILAYLHQDDDLKGDVQDYILQHNQEVFGTHEWKDLMNTHIKLAADVMYKKVYNPGNV